MPSLEKTAALAAWRGWLASQGARLVAMDATVAVLSYADPGEPQSAGRLFDLNHLDLLRIAGPQAASFLQGYVTCDMETQDDGSLQPGAGCNRQGRVIVDFDVIRLGEEDVLLRLSAGAQALFAGCLARYIPFAKAELDPNPTACIGIGLWCAEPPTASRDLLGAVPAPGQVLRCPQGFWLQHQAGERYELWLEPAMARKIWEQERLQLTPTGVNAWDLADVRADRARVTAAISERFLPQALGYADLGAISFDKGCYLGQEVVARATHRGRLKRGLTRLAGSFAADTDPHSLPPAPGTRLLAGDARGAGEIVRAASTGRGLEALAICPLNDTDARMQVAGWPGMLLQKQRAGV